MVATDTDGMLTQGRNLAKIHKNVVVEVPLTRDGIRACSMFSREGIRVNVTLCFSAGQALRWPPRPGPISSARFVGRVDDTGWDGMQLIRDIVQIYKNYNYPTQILAASLRHSNHVIDAAKAGAHVGTSMPFKVLDALFSHPLTDKGLANRISSRTTPKRCSGRLRSAANHS